MTPLFPPPPPPWFPPKPRGEGGALKRKGMGLKGKGKGWSGKKEQGKRAAPDLRRISTLPPHCAHARTRRNDFPVGAAALLPQPAIYIYIYIYIAASQLLGIMGTCLIAPHSYSASWSQSPRISNSQNGRHRDLLGPIASRSHQLWQYASFKAYKCLVSTDTSYICSLYLLIYVSIHLCIIM